MKLPVMLDFSSLGIKELEKLMNSSKDDPENLKVVIGYVHSIISGKEANYCDNPRIKTAIKKLIHEYHELTLLDINRDVKELEKILDEKKQDVKTLGEQIEELKGIKESLITAIADLNKTLEKTLISSGEIKRYDVTWRLVTEDHPIYETCYKNIEDYFKRLTLEYMEKMGTTPTKAIEEFKLHAPFWKDLVDMVVSFKNPNIIGTQSIKKIIYDHEWDERAQKDANKIKMWLKNLRLPEYTLIKEEEPPSAILTKTPR